MINARVLVALAFLCLVLNPPRAGANPEPVTPERGADWTAGQTRTIEAGGRGNPWINVIDGRELPVIYRKGPPAFERLLRKGKSVPTALAAADLNGAGLADLVVGYAGADGGWLTLHRANLAARDPSGRRARQGRREGTFPEVPFLQEARVVALPVAPHFLATGDFDADGHDDLVVAQRDRAELWWLPGTGGGELGTPRSIPLNGVVTALVTGSIRHRDDADDIVIGIRREQRGELWVVGLQNGKSRKPTRVLAFEAPINALALGQLGMGKPLDLVVASGNQLTVLFGDGSGRFDTATAQRHKFSEEIRALTVGDFTRVEGGGPGLAVVLGDASMRVMFRDERREGRAASFVFEQDALPATGGVHGVVALNLSNRPGHDLLFYDPTVRRVHVRTAGKTHVAWASFETLAPPVAVLPMQLNADAFSDLVVLLEGASAPSVLLTTPGAVFTVDSTGDDPDLDWGDGVCATPIGDCTLRAAIDQANAATGTDAIVFDIPGAGPHTIQPLTPLPWIVDPVLLDGTTEPDFVDHPVVEVDGSLAGETDGLALATGSSTVRGLAINRFLITGLIAVGPDAIDNRIQGNYIGTDVTGTTALANGGNGVYVADGARLNIVGTDGDNVADAAERNLLSGNGASGVILTGTDTDENVVAGNYIGTDATGTLALGNGDTGVVIIDAADNRIGGSVPAARNLLSGNVSNGIYISGLAATGNRVQGNYIGTEASGAAALGNGTGVIVVNSPFNVVGTDGDGVDDATEGNVVSGNAYNGVLILGPDADENVIAGNFLGTDAYGTVALGNGEFGAAVIEGQFNRVGTNADGVSDAEERNVLSGNLRLGVLFAFEAEHNVIAGNFIGTDPTGTLAVPNLLGGVELSNGVRFNRVGTDADGQFDAAERNVISGNVGPGITMFGEPSVDNNVIAGNLIGTQVDGVTPLGNSNHGIVITTDANNNTIGGLGVTPGTCDGPCNRIAYNGTGASLDGVRIAAGTGNAVVGNVIHSNMGGTGIDIANAGPTPNDPGDVDGGSDNGQNFPVLMDATTAGSTTTIRGTLDSVPDTEFRLEFYANSACDNSGYGQAEMLVGVQTVTTGNDGQTVFAVPISPAVPDGYVLSSTATRMEPGDVPTDTSELSPCLGLGPPTGAGRVPDGDEVPGPELHLDKGDGRAVFLSWGASCVAVDVDYAVYIGTLGAFTSHYARVCSSEGLTMKRIWTIEDNAYYLVVPLSANREGSYGTDSAGNQRPPGTGTCHPQAIEECP